MTIEQLLGDIDDLIKDVLVATNEGSFTAEECCRAVGCGDPVYGTWRTFERLDGSRYTTGADRTGAPGYTRPIKHLSASTRREKIAALKLALNRSQTVEQQQASHRAGLARGWDGYQFVGEEEGSRRLAKM